ncbi:RNA-binding protein 25-like protein [Dinothrombium tinctorium]|uniref:RNA-binding protein 25-like protein n=1 Tax=Dinothrombium tinctorium TaxID=1965070 RepID=A0A443R011_9ACAR|nr:RNA-binding protein 25-like protein [Dinothrombium tinctorium]
MSFPPPPGAHFLQNLSAMASMMNPAQYQMTPMGGIIPMTVGVHNPQFQALQASMGITVPTGVTTISAPPVRKLTVDSTSMLGTNSALQQNLTNDAQNQQNKKKSPSGPTITVFVGNITERASDMLIRQLLSKCGTVNNWKRVQGANGKLQAFGFCEYSDAESAMRAIRLLHEFEIADKKLVVKVDAKTKEKLDEYVRTRDTDSNSVDNSELVDEETKKEDELIATQLTGILREHEIELSRSPDPSRDRSRRVENKRPGDPAKPENLADIEMEEEKRSLIHREIYKFRDTYKKSVEDRRDNRRQRNRERTPVKDRTSRKERDRYDGRDRLDDRNNSNDRVIEDEEEAYERRRMERKLREKEASYQERLRNWEAREMRKAKEYEKERLKQEAKREEEAKEVKRLKQFLEDYDDDRDDNKFYKGSAFNRRLRERQKEKEDDERDARQEKRELEELRRKLTEEGHPDPDSEAKKRLNSSDMERERDKIVNAKIKELMSEARAKAGKPCEEEEVSLSGLSDGTPLEEIHVKSFTFTGMKIGHSSSSHSQNVSTISPAEHSNLASGDKRKKLSVQDVFNSNDDDDALAGGKRRKLPSLIDDNTDSNQSVLSNTQKGMGDNPKSLSSEEKRKQIKSLIEKIPTSKDELFTYSIDWSVVDNTLMEKRIRPWINKKITEYIGEEEQQLLDFICTKLQARSSAQSILDDVAMVLDEEAEVFVVKMWRLLIYEVEAKKLGLGKQ